MHVHMFPGQGSQKRGMGAGLFDTTPEFAAVEPQIDQILGYSLRRLCLEDPQGQLKDTRYTQPSLFIVNALHYYREKRSGERPSFVIGHSLGEYNALLAAGVFDLLTGLRIVQKRGELMAHVKNGGMAAVIGLPLRTVNMVIQDNGLGVIDIANLNSPQQIVVSGPSEAISRAASIFEKAGARMCVPLQVSAAFHSRYMADVAGAFLDYLRPINLSAPQIPVISNVTARPYPMGASGDEIKALLAKQIASSVRWVESIDYLLESGATKFAEIGPGAVLTGLLNQIRAKVA